MPTIEFFGFPQNKIVSMVESIKDRLSQLSFRDQIVFVLKQNEESKVISWDGEELPFIRVLTRSKDRAHMIKSQLTDFVDVEIVYIEFYPKTKHDAK